MRISDWSSDVCSSDLVERLVRQIDLARAIDAQERAQQFQIAIGEDIAGAGEGAAQFGKVRILRAAALPAGGGRRQHRAHELREIDALDRAIGDFEFAFASTGAAAPALAAARAVDWNAVRPTSVETLKIGRESVWA